MALGFTVDQPGRSLPPSANPFRAQPCRTGFWKGWRQAQRNASSNRPINQRAMYIGNVIPVQAYRPAVLTVDAGTDSNLRSQVLQAAAERAQMIVPQTPAQAAQAARSVA